MNDLTHTEIELLDVNFALMWLRARFVRCLDRREWLSSLLLWLSHCDYLSVNFANSVSCPCSMGHVCDVSMWSLLIMIPNRCHRRNANSADSAVWSPATVIGHVDMLVDLMLYSSVLWSQLAFSHPMSVCTPIQYKKKTFWNRNRAELEFIAYTLFLRDSLSNDLNQPLLVDGVGFGDASLRWLDICDNFELFCDGIRFGMGLAFGVDRRRRVAMSMGRGGDDVSNVSTAFGFREISDLFDGGEVDFFRVNNSFTCCYCVKRKQIQSSIDYSGWRFFPIFSICSIGNTYLLQTAKFVITFFRFVAVLGFAIERTMVSCILGIFIKMWIKMWTIVDAAFAKNEVIPPFTGMQRFRKLTFTFQKEFRYIFYVIRQVPETAVSTFGIRCVKNENEFRSI